jgi:hypothetical protein
VLCPYTRLAADVALISRASFYFSSNLSLSGNSADDPPTIAS